MLPELWRTNTEFWVHVRLIPEYHVFQLIGPGSIINDETFVIFRTLAHDLTEEIKTWEGRAKIVINTLTIIDEVFTKNEYVVHIGTEDWWNTERVLHSNDKEDLLVSAVEENIANVFVIDP